MSNTGFNYKDWYMATPEEVARFFDTDTNVGLDPDNVITRLKKFGQNRDPFIKPSLQESFKINVKRLGHIERISSINIVPGDIVLLEPGDLIPADIRLFHVRGLVIDQSKITGDHLAAFKNTFSAREALSIADQKCMVFAGTLVAAGSGMGIVVAQAQKSEQTKLLPAKKLKNKVVTSMNNRRLKHFGIAINKNDAAINLKNIDIVFIQADIADDAVIEIIQKVQLAKNIPCKFVVSSQFAERQLKNLPATIIYKAEDIRKHVSKQHINMVRESQFIADATPEDCVKVVSSMQKLGLKILWVTDGAVCNPVITVADCSLIIGNYARGDMLIHAGLVATKAKPIILDRILYNKK